MRLEIQLKISDIPKAERYDLLRQLVRYELTVKQVAELLWDEYDEENRRKAVKIPYPPKGVSVKARIVGYAIPSDEMRTQYKRLARRKRARIDMIENECFSQSRIMFRLVHVWSRPRWFDKGWFQTVVYRVIE